MMSSSLDIITRQQAEQLVQLSTLVKSFASIVSAMDQRIARLETMLSQKITITHTQSKALQTQIAGRAADLCTKHNLVSKNAGAKIRAAIRRDVLSQCGVSDLHDIPSNYYDIAVGIITGWTSYRLIMSLHHEED